MTHVPNASLLLVLCFDFKKNVQNQRKLNIIRFLAPLTMSFEINFLFQHTNWMSSNFFTPPSENPHTPDDGEGIFPLSKWNN